MNSFYHFCPIRKILLDSGSKELWLQAQAPRDLIPKSTQVVRVNDTLLVELEEHRYADWHKAHWTMFVDLLQGEILPPVRAIQHYYFRHKLEPQKGVSTAVQGTEKSRQRFLVARHDSGRKHPCTSFVFPEQGTFHLSAVCQIPGGWKQAGNHTTTTAAEGRSDLKPCHNENPSTSIGHQYLNRF